MTKRHHSKKPRAKSSAPTPQDGAVNPDLLAQLARTLWLPHDLDAAEKAARLAAASVLLEDINPAAGVESMLAVQMVATHEAALECLRRSMAPDPSPEERDQNLKHSERLLALYARQMDVLGRHRTREQKLKQQRHEERRAAKPKIRKMQHVFIQPDGTWETLEETAKREAKQTAARENAQGTSGRANGHGGGGPERGRDPGDI